LSVNENIVPQPRASVPMALWGWARRGSISPLVVLAAALGAPAVLATALHLLSPHLPWSMLALQSISLGGVGALLVIVVNSLLFAMVYASRLVRARRLARTSVFATVVALARVRFYRTTDHPDPEGAASLDVVAYVNGTAADAAIKAWEVNAARLMLTTGAFEQLAIPNAVAETILARHGVTDKPGSDQ